MKNLLKKLSPLFALVMVFALCCALVGCGDKDHTEADFEFTEEVISKINDVKFSNFLIDYCNDFYKNFKVECNQKLYIENDKIESTAAKRITSKIDELAMSYYLAGDEDGAREMVKFYLPFQQLGAIRAQEYLQTKFNFTIDTDGNSTETPISPLTQTYIDGINEQFNILKKDYFKK